MNFYNLVLYNDSSFLCGALSADGRSLDTRRDATRPDATFFIGRHWEL